MQYKGLSISQGYNIGEVCFFNKSRGGLSPRKKGQPIIVAASKLTPQDTMGFRKFNIVGIIVEEGSPNSHVSILAKVMDIPAIVVNKCLPQWNEKTAIIDGLTGSLIIEPDEEDISDFYQKIEEIKKEKEILADFKGERTITKNGLPIKLYANITGLDDIDSVLANDAEGIGNFKTEFMFLNAKDFPSEEFQFDIYREIVKKMGRKKVVIRTLDIGADKTPNYFHLPKEDNPALGYRAIRICLDKQDIFLTQIKAILRASAFGNVSIMYPMITSESEIISIKKIVNRAMRDLSEEGIPYDEQIEQGIMIETPASVLISRELAQLVDFFSIGTNDLTQYMLAADRANKKVNEFVNPYHPSILRSIEYVIKNAHEEGIWVSISGELGSDLSMTKFFIDHGLDALTVSPNKILELKKEISNI